MNWDAYVHLLGNVPFLDEEGNAVIKEFLDFSLDSYYMILPCIIRIKTIYHTVKPISEMCR